MGKTQEEIEPKNKRRQSRGLHQVPELQTRKCKTEANGLVGSLGEKRTELLNAGHMMDDETFITLLLNSLPQPEYEGPILVIKDKLRKGDIDIPEIDQILEDKYQSMKHVQGWDEEEDDYVLFTIQSNKKSPKSNLKDFVGTVENLHKAADCPNKKSNQNKGSKGESEQKKKQSTKGDHNGKGQKDISKINCYNWGEY